MVEFNKLVTINLSQNNRIIQLAKVKTKQY